MKMAHPLVNYGDYRHTHKKESKVRHTPLTFFRKRNINISGSNFNIITNCLLSIFPTGKEGGELKKSEVMLDWV